MQLNPLTLTALGAIFGVLAASSLSKALRYTAPDECKWVSLRDAGGAGFGEDEAAWEGAGEDPDDPDGSLLDDDGEGDDEEVSLFCRLRTINSELENTNFSAIQPRHTAALRLECSDALFFQSSLRTDSFRALTFLRTLSIEYCKLGSLPAGAFRGLTRLRRLTLRTHNADWSALALDVEKGAFSASDLPRLTHLDLSENNLWSLPPSVFCPLPLLKTLNLTKNRLRDVTAFKFTAPEGSGNPSSMLDIPHCGARLQVLDLSNNSVESLPAGALSGLSRLRELRLEGNALSFVADGAFQGLTSLAVLRLSHNRLSSLPPELFASSRDLREIHLSNNSVSVLAPGLLAGLERLQLLDLSQNELTSDWVNGATLAGLVRLVVLDISHNRLGPRIDAAVFRDLYSLQILRLSDNVIEALPEAAFSALANLHTLVLSRNRLTAVRAAPAIPPVGMANVGISTSTKPETSPFSGLRALSLLALDGNSLMTLEAEALSDCAGLQDLHINGNRLRIVPPGLSTTLPQLRTIDLGENAITAIDNTSFAPNGLPHLYGLRLTDNLMIELKRGALKALPALKILNLSRNRISYIEPGAFDDNQALQAVRVDGNQLAEITGLFSKLPNLIWLNASDNRLEWFDYALIPTGLQWLDIHSNSIAELGGSHFEIESKLKLSTLDASSNKLTELSGSAVPDSVELLFLGDNRIERVQPYAFFRKPNLTRVDLMKNNITHLGPNSLRISAVSHLRSLPEFYIGGNPFACDCTMDWLQRVNNDGSRLRNQPRVMDLNSIYCRLVHGRGRKFMPLVEAAPSDFLCPYETHCFALCHCCDFDACDCEMTCPPDCICHHDQSWSANVVDCSTAGLLGLPARIPMDATEVYLDGNSLGKITSHAFIGRKRLRSLFLNASAIDTIANRSFNGLPDLRILYLQENLLGELKGYEFEGLPALQELYLQGNRLTSVAATTFSPLIALQILNLERNKIMSFSVWSLESNTALSSIRLSHNPWSCDCDFLTHYKEWLQGGAADAVEDMSKIRCYSIGNSTNVEGHSMNNSLIDTVSADWEETLFNDPTITSFLLIHDNNTSCGLWGQNGTSLSSGNNFLAEPLIRDYLPLLIAALTVFVIVTFLSLLIFIYRLELRVWFHSRYGVRLFLFPSSSSSMGASQIGDSDKLFDAFISYSSKDEAFVAQELAPSLEPNYKLCLHYRDFPVGGYITDTIVQAVESSKRTIMVLSENFIRSEWCRFEFKSAHHRVLRDRRRRLIVIILGEVPPARELDPDIRLYLKTNTYLQWGDKLFWEKLRYALPDVPNNRRRGAGGGGGADVKK